MSALLFILSGLWSRLTGILSFLARPPGLYIAAAVGLAVAFWWHGNDRYSAGQADERTAQEIARKGAEVAAYARGVARQYQIDKGLIAAADKAGFERGKAQARTVTLTKEIVRYVTPETDARFTLPCGMLRLHDAAALGVGAETLRNPSGLADGDACPVKASDLAAVIVWNYGLDHQKDAQIAGLQDLARTLKAALEGLAPN